MSARSAFPLAVLLVVLLGAAAYWSTTRSPGPPPEEAPAHARPVLDAPRRAKPTGAAGMDRPDPGAAPERRGAGSGAEVPDDGLIEERRDGPFVSRTYAGVPVEEVEAEAQERREERAQRAEEQFRLAVLGFAGDHGIEDETAHELIRLVLAERSALRELRGRDAGAAVSAEVEGELDAVRRKTADRIEELLDESQQEAWSRFLRPGQSGAGKK